jgi:type II secretion system protein C
MEYIDMRIVTNKIFEFLYQVVIVILSIKLLWTIVNFFLPQNGLQTKIVASRPIVRVDVNRLFDANLVREVIKEPQERRKQKSNLNGVELKAIYIDQDSSNGFVTLQDRSGSYFLSIGEKYKEYELIAISVKEAIFKDARGKYTLELNSGIKSLTELMDLVQTSERTTTIDREVLNSYIRDIKKIWDNITIVDYVQDGKLTGFKVMRVNEASIFFQKLGMRKGDIIQSINGEIIESYKDAINFYKDIENRNYLNLGILRGGNMMELEYEIY